MGPQQPKKHPERESTDDSLREERDKTDSELARKRAGIEEDADQVVLRARHRADDVLRTTRSAADDRGDRNADPGAVERERRRADDIISSEREAEDEVLDAEREARRRALADLLGLEREQTDLHLLTERARSDEALTTRDDFLAMVSHDLRTLLAGIAMKAAMIAKRSLDDGPEAGKVRADAATIERFTGRMSRLIGDLVDVATMETGRPLVAPERQDLERLLRESDEAFQPIAAAHGLLFTSEIVERPEIATFDHDRILQVLANLVGNAIKFTPAGGRISLRVEDMEGEVRFAVRDTGSGIPADQLQRVFDRFWQAGRHDRRGLGLGLYISRCIVEGHGGRIWAESTLGAGTTIFFTLPQAERK